MGALPVRRAAPALPAESLESLESLELPECVPVLCLLRLGRSKAHRCYEI